jgi:hypothetical protein
MMLLVLTSAHWEMCLTALGDYLSNTSRLLATLWEMLEEYWRAFQQCLQSSGYTLGNTKIKVETQWVHLPPGTSAKRNKKTHLAHRSASTTDFRYFLSISTKYGGIFLNLLKNWRFNKKIILLLANLKVVRQSL